MWIVAKRRGFTLIELLIVIVIIGLLATIAIPKFNKSREKAYFKTLTYDLRNLATQQELYYGLPQNAYNYASATSQLPDFDASRGVSIAILSASTEGWAATATHAGLVSTQQCGVFAGTPGSLPSWLTTAGNVTCTGD